MPNAQQLKTALNKVVWDTELETLPWWRVWLTKVLRISYVVIRDLFDGQLTLRAMSLVYTTLLALVPLLAVSFSVLKGFGVHNEIEPLLFNFLKPLGEKGIELGSRIIGFVDNVKAGVLGSVGLALLIYTVISLIQKVEGAFNYTWHVKRGRPFAQRFSDYLSVILIGPVLLFSALGITASLTSTKVARKLVAIEPFGSFLKMSGELIPYFLIITAFTFFYVFVPNTKVRFRSALCGAAIAGILWGATDWAFASFIATSTKYTAIYSGFAILVMFMIWVYVSWLILLVGASIAFYHQNPEYLIAHQRELQLSNRMKEKLSLLVMFLIGQNYYNQGPAWTVEGLTQRLRVPMEALEPIVEALELYGLLASTGDDPPAYLPAQPLDNTEIADVLNAVRTVNEESHPDLLEPSSEPAVEQLIDQVQQAISKQLRGHTLKELALSEPSSVTLVSQSSQQQKTFTGDSQ
jgi:membrane protein